jgi:hypothetical protein
METVRRYFTESCKIFTANVTFTDVYTDGYSIRRHFTESWKIFTRNAIITDVYTDEYVSIGISLRVEKYLLEMP